MMETTEAATTGFITLSGKTHVLARARGALYRAGGLLVALLGLAFLLRGLGVHGL